MNLSCSGGGLPESGCLFFKVAGSTLSSGNVINGRHILQFFSIVLNLYFTAKFNCTVLGTLYDFIEECNIIISDEMPTETTSIVTAMVTTTVTSISNYMSTNILTTHTSFGIPLLVSVIGDLVIAVILAVSIFIICVIVRFKVGSLRKFNSQQNNSSSTATASSNTIPQEMTPGNAYNCMNQCMCA